VLIAALMHVLLVPTCFVDTAGRHHHQWNRTIEQRFQHVAVEYWFTCC